MSTAQIQKMFQIFTKKVFRNSPHELFQNKETIPEEIATETNTPVFETIDFEKFQKNKISSELLVDIGEISDADNESEFEDENEMLPLPTCDLEVELEDEVRLNEENLVEEETTNGYWIMDGDLPLLDEDLLPLIRGSNKMQKKFIPDKNTFGSFIKRVKLLPLTWKSKFPIQSISNSLSQLYAK